jgi:hypothetical protein
LGVCVAPVLAFPRLSELADDSGLPCDEPLVLVIDGARECVLRLCVEEGRLGAGPAGDGLACARSFGVWKGHMWPEGNDAKTI